MVQASVVTAIEYVSYADATGYGQAAIGYIRLLLNAGIDAHWTPFLNDALWSGRIEPEHTGIELARGRAAIVGWGDNRSGGDLRTLIEATSRPVRPSLWILHILPRFWREHMRAAPHLPHVGMTVWETDKLNKQWLILLA
jgi:hypothetical protein